MSVIVFKTEAVCRLENLIGDGKKVFVYGHNDMGILHLIYEGLKKKKTSNVEILQCIGESSNYEYSTYVTRKEMDEILEIYHMYDFSDKVSVVSEPDQYGNLFNYVKNGILTKQEMVDALLYKI